MNNKQLIEEFGSPLYIYKKDILENRCKNIKKFEESIKSNLNKEINVSMHYSTKANNNPNILKIVKENGIKVDCMSPLEVRVNEIAGYDYSDMLYVCNNIDKEEMEFIYEKGILPCFDSISQVELWGSMYPNTDIMIRINPSVGGVGHSDKVITAGDTKFGISEKNIPVLIFTCKNLNVNIIGIHQHLGSLFLNDKIDDYITGVEAGLDIVRKYFDDIKIIDLGGGFGVPYKEDEEHLDFSRVLNKLVPVLNNFLKSYDSIEEFKFEPGRYIPCESGMILGRVNAIKYENEKYWIGTDIGMNILVRPSMYDAYHKIEIESDNKEKVVANICGNICESGDILGKDREVILPNVGDVVKVYNAGAYGFSMSSNYTGRVKSAEVLIDGNNKIIIRNRESISDILKNIVIE